MQINVATIQPESQLTSFIDWLEYIKEERLKLTEILDKKEDERES